MPHPALSFRQLAFPLGLLFLSGVPASADDHEVWRLFVADHTQPVVRVLELNGTSLGRFETKGPASLALGPSGTVVYAIQGDADQVQAIDSGISFDEHGDHADMEVAAPKMIEAVLHGDKPSHFVVHEGAIAVFYDGEGIARIYTETGLAKGIVPQEVKTTAPHHGVAARVGGYTLVSIPHPEDPSELPVGLRVLDREGKQIGEDHACPDLHGEAASGNLVAFACAAGILLVEPGKNSPPAIRLLPYPPELPEGKSTTLLGGVGLQYFVGNYGADAIVVLDPSTKDFTRVELPTRRVHFAVDRERPQLLYVFTEDGQLHQINVLSGEIKRSVKLTQPYSMDGHWRDPRPRITVAGDDVVVTDPLAGVIHLLDAETLSKENEIKVEGMPYNIVAVGGHGEHH